MSAGHRQYGVPTQNSLKALFEGCQARAVAQLVAEGSVRPSLMLMRVLPDATTPDMCAMASLGDLYDSNASKDALAQLINSLLWTRLAPGQINAANLSWQPNLIIQVAEAWAYTVSYADPGAAQRVAAAHRLGPANMPERTETIVFMVSTAAGLKVATSPFQRLEGGRYEVQHGELGELNTTVSRFNVGMGPDSDTFWPDRQAHRGS